MKIIKTEEQKEKRLKKVKRTCETPSIGINFALHKSQKERKEQREYSEKYLRCNQ